MICKRAASWASFVGPVRGMSTLVRPYEDLPAPKEYSWPFIGHGHLIIKKPDGMKKFWKQVLHLKNKYVPEDVGILRLHLPVLNKTNEGRVVLLFKPEDISEIYKHEGQYPCRGLKVLEVLKTMRANHPDIFHETMGFLSEEGKRWHHLRSRVQQDMMKPQSAFFFIDKLQNTAQQLVDHIRRHRNADNVLEKDFTPLAHLFAVESISMITLNTTLRALDDEHPPDVEAYLDAIDYVTKHIHHFVTSVPLWRFLPPRWSPFYRRMEDQASVIYYFNRDKTNEFKDKLGQMEANGQSLDDDQMSVLEKLIRHNAPDSTIPMVTALDSMIAGVDTTANTLSFLVYHLATNPDKQERLREEVLSLGHSHLTVQDVGRLKYFRACLQESYRLKPTFFYMGRVLDHDINLRGFHVPAGTIFMWVNAVIGQDERLFPQPERFLPERWLDPQTKTHPFSVRLYGHGPRSCIGKRFAQLELQLVMAKLMQNFRIRWNADYEIETSAQLFNTPDKPMILSFADVSN